MAKLTAIELFVKDHLTYVNRSAGEIEYEYEGCNYEEGFANDNPLLGIRAAIKRIKEWSSEDKQPNDR